MRKVKLLMIIAISILAISCEKGKGEEEGEGEVINAGTYRIELETNSSVDELGIVLTVLGEKGGKVTELTKEMEEEEGGYIKGIYNKTLKQFKNINFTVTKVISLGCVLNFSNNEEYNPIYKGMCKIYYNNQILKEISFENKKFLMFNAYSNKVLVNDDL